VETFNLSNAANLKVGNPLHAIPILVTKLSVKAENFLLIACERTPQAIILALALIVKHVHIDLAHQAARTAIV
jgi:hypothetical protein